MIAMNLEERKILEDIRTRLMDNTEIDGMDR